MMVDADNIFSIQAKRVEEVVEQLGITTDLARALLIKNGWETQEAIDEFLDDENYITNTFKFSLEEGERRVAMFKAEPEFTCECCYCDYERKDAVMLEDCGHVLCNECYTAYLESKI